MSRVLSFITSSFWVMRQQEFDVMTFVAVRQLEVLEKIVSEIETKPLPETMASKKGERLMNTRYTEIREGSVAVIDVNGRLAKRMGFFAEVCEGGTSTETLLKDFQTALDNPTVSSIVFHIDSPGGEAFGINEISQHIFNARGKKPMKAYVSGLGCSGAYWIASACDEIICDKSAFLGSIGVVSVSIDDTNAYKMLGFDKKVVTSSNAPKKRLDLNTDEGMSEFQKELDSLESVFIKTVARNRKISVEQVKTDFNQGGVLAGAEAVKVKMADRVGSLEGVIKELARKGKTGASIGAENKQGELTMGFKDEFKAFASKLGFSVSETETVEAEKKAAVETEKVETNIETEKLISEKQLAEKRASEAEKELAKVKSESLAKDVDSFITAEISAGRMIPAEKEGFKSLYLQAVADDEANSLADGSRLENLKAIQGKRKPHQLTKEVLSPKNGLQIVQADESPENISEARQKELMEKTPLGKAALKVVK